MVVKMDKIIELMGKSLNTHLKRKLRGRIDESIIDDCLDEFFKVSTKTKESSSSSTSYTHEELAEFTIRDLRGIGEGLSIPSSKLITKGNCIQAILDVQKNPESDSKKEQKDTTTAKSSLPTTTTKPKNNYSISESENDDDEDDTPPLSEKALVDMKAAELKQLCIDRKLPRTGNRQTLIDRLLNRESVPKTPGRQRKEAVAKTPGRRCAAAPQPSSPPPPKPSTSKGKERARKSVIDALRETAKTPVNIITEKKTIGNRDYNIDPNNGWVFDDDDDQVIAVFCDGHIQSLSRTDIDEIKSAGLAVKYTDICNEDSSDCD